MRSTQAPGVLNRSPSGTPHAAHAALNIVKLRTTVFPEYDATTEHDGGGGGDLSDRIIDFLASATQENWDLAVEATFDALVKMLNLTLEWDRAIARFTQKSEQMRKVLVKTLDQVSDAQDDAVEAVLANREKLSDDERCG